MTIDTSREAVEQINKELSWDDSLGAIELINALLARAEAAEDKIENAVQAMAETQPSWEYRCHAIVSALGMDFGGPTPEGIPEEHTWYARNLKRANTERDTALAEVAHLRGEVQGWAANAVYERGRATELEFEVARLSTPPDDAETAKLVERLNSLSDELWWRPLAMEAADALTRLSQALAAETAKREAMEEALEEISTYDTGGTAGVAYTAKVTLAKHGSK